MNDSHIITALFAAGLCACSASEDSSNGSSGATSSLGGTAGTAATAGAAGEANGASGTTAGGAGGTGGQAAGGASLGGEAGQSAGGTGGQGGAAGASGQSGGGAGGAEQVVCDLEADGAGADLFSSFIISYQALQREATEMGLPNPELGLGGNLGGIEGADAICQRAAQYSTGCAANKTWHAFLSTSTVDAIDRIGTGPWYDRLGRKIADTLEDLQNERPNNIDATIRTDWPNEFGVPNHDPDGTGDVDNHEVLTGSGEDGRLYMQQGTGNYGSSNGCNDYEWTVAHATCNDWTSSEEEGCPRVGHSWYEGQGGSGRHWISVWNEGGCARGVNLIQMGGIQMDQKTVGSAGGYGGYYCFAVTGQ